MVKEMLRLDSCQVRSMCIKNNWYTLGTNEEYTHMFSMCDIEPMTHEILYQIAQDIYNHSSLKSALNGISVGCTDIENILNIMSYLRDCTVAWYAWENPSLSSLEEGDFVYIVNPVYCVEIFNRQELDAPSSRFVGYDHNDGEEIIFTWEQVEEVHRNGHQIWQKPEDALGEVESC